MEFFEGLASLIVGENPLEPERLWYKMYRGSIYYGRRGAAIQAISAIDIASGTSWASSTGSPCRVLLGARVARAACARTLALYSGPRRRHARGRPPISRPGLHRRQVRLGCIWRGSADATFNSWRPPEQSWRRHRPARRHRLVRRAHAEAGDSDRSARSSPTGRSSSRRSCTRRITTATGRWPTPSTPSIACGEQEATEWGFRELIERGRVDVLQPDLTRCGGFTVARKIVHMAERANVLVIPHSWSSDLLTAASLHLNAFQRRAVFIEFNTSQGPLSREMVKEPLRMTDGYLDVPDGPGLGVEVNEEVISKYRIA